MKTLIHTRKYPAKLLLFGEYTVLEGGQALALPVWDFSGEWVFEGGGAQSFGESLNELAAWLVERERLGSLEGRWMLHRLRADLLSGAVFRSSIPAGYGLGSSGALVAALFETYCTDSERLESLPLGHLRAMLAEVESFFHGTSSGVDPLVSLLGKPLLIDGDELKAVRGREWAAQGKVALFLFDTQHPRQTAPLVAAFRKRLAAEPDFAKAIDAFKVANDAAVYAFLHGSADELAEAWCRISALQVRHMQEMIPSGAAELWREGLATDRWWLKLCGAGGGGYLLGLTPDWDTTRQALGAERLHLLGFLD